MKSIVQMKYVYKAPEGSIASAIGSTSKGATSIYNGMSDDEDDGDDDRGDADGDDAPGVDCR